MEFERQFASEVACYFALTKYPNLIIFRFEISLKSKWQDRSISNRQFLNHNELIPLPVTLSVTTPVTALTPTGTTWIFVLRTGFVHIER